MVCLISFVVFFVVFLFDCLLRCLNLWSYWFLFSPGNEMGGITGAATGGIITGAGGTALACPIGIARLNFAGAGSFFLAVSELFIIQKRFLRTLLVLSVFCESRARFQLLGFNLFENMGYFVWSD